MNFILIKLGGSVITDKSKPFSFHESIIRQIGRTLRAHLDSHPDTHIILGNGAGSFGHYMVHEVGYRDAKEDLVRASKVRQSSIELNMRVSKILLDCGLPIFNTQPSAFLERNPDLAGDITVVEKALEAKGIPLVYGDVILDSSYGTSIASTEDLLNYLGKKLVGDGHACKAVVYLTNVPGVLNGYGKIVKKFSSTSNGLFTKNKDFDVTGGMAQKVSQGFDGLSFAEHVYIIDGKNPDAISGALVQKNTGTELVKSN